MKSAQTPFADEGCEMLLKAQEKASKLILNWIICQTTVSKAKN